MLCGKVGRRNAGVSPAGPAASRRRTHRAAMARAIRPRAHPPAHPNAVAKTAPYCRRMTQHASSLPPSTAPEPTYAERVRTLLERESLGTLSTHSVKHPGWPFGSVMPYALEAGGAPLFLISGMAIHTQNVVADPRASLLVMQRGNDADPLGMARATLLGTVSRIDTVTDDLRQAYLARHPNARHWIDYADFGFFRLDVTQIYFVGGFGVMGWVPSDDYATAASDPLADAAAGIIEHMNRDHADALREITRHFGNVEAEESTMVACDRLGFVVRMRTAEGMRGMRIAFPEEVRSSEEARRVLVAMVKQARASA
jgi:putative heme iron utilization protein